MHLQHHHDRITYYIICLDMILTCSTPNETADSNYYSTMRTRNNSCCSDIILQEWPNRYLAYFSGSHLIVTFLQKKFFIRI